MNKMFKLSSTVLCCFLEAVNAGCVGDENNVCAADKESAFNHADNSLDTLFQLRRVGDWTKVAVQNPVAAVGTKGLIGR